MAKFFVSLCVALSVFAFVCVNGQDKYAIPPLVAPITSVNFNAPYRMTLYNITDYSASSSSVPKMIVSTTASKLGNNLYLTISHSGDVIDGRTIPFGIYLYRDDAKKLVFYSPVGSGANNNIHRCEDKGASTFDSVLAMMSDYIDIAHAVRGKAIFTNKASITISGLSADSYTYFEEKDITNNDVYDKVGITHTYAIERSTQLCISITRDYKRHIKNGDYETSNYVQESVTLNGLPTSILSTDSILLRSNENTAVATKYYNNVIDNALYPNVWAGSTQILVCPEIDFLPRPLLVSFLAATNFSEYELVLDNPVSIERLMEDTRKILNLTNTQEESYQVAFDSVNKIGDKWSVNIVMPAKVSEALAAAVENGDVKKSELPVISKVKKMNKLN